MRISPAFVFATFLIIGPNILFVGEANSKKESPKHTRQVKYLKVSSGDTVYSILRRYDFSPQQINEAIQRKLIPKNYVISPGDFYALTRDREQKYSEIKFFDPWSDNGITFWRMGARTGVKREKIPYEVRTRTVEGKILGSIIGSIKAKVKDDWIALRFMDAYHLDYNLTKSVQRGAKFSITFEEKYLGKSFIRYGEVLQTELQLDGKNVARHFVKYEGGGGFIDDALMRSPRPLFAPVDYLHISSLFKPRRFHPIKKRRIAHLGVDFVLPAGSPVYAALAGEVIRMGRNRGAGNYVAIRHKNGIETYYNHLESFARKLKVGSKVRSGQAIGAIGCTGYCTKPHLHFAIKKKGQYLNPLPYIKSFSYSGKSAVSKLVAHLED